MCTRSGQGGASKAGKENQRSTHDDKKNMRATTKWNEKGWRIEEKGENVVTLRCVIVAHLTLIIHCCWPFRAVVSLNQGCSAAGVARARLRVLHLLCNIASTIRVLLLILRTSAASRNRAHYWKRKGGVYLRLQCVVWGGMFFFFSLLSWLFFCS